MFQLVLKFKFRMCNDCWRRRMTKVWDSQLGDSLVKPHSAFPYFFSDKLRTMMRLLVFPQPKGERSMGSMPPAPPPPYICHWLGLLIFIRRLLDMWLGRFIVAMMIHTWCTMCSSRGRINVWSFCSQGKVWEWLNSLPCWFISFYSIYNFEIDWFHMFICMLFFVQT